MRPESLMRFAARVFGEHCASQSYSIRPTWHGIDPRHITDITSYSFNSTFVCLSVSEEPNTIMSMHANSCHVDHETLVLSANGTGSRANTSAVVDDSMLTSMTGVLGWLFQEQLVRSGLLLTILGCLGSLGWTLMGWVQDLVVRLLVVRLYVTNQDEAFQWLLEWLAKQDNFLASQKLTIKVERQIWRYRAKWSTGKTVDTEMPFVSLLPGHGPNTFWFRGRLFWMARWPANNLTTTGWDHQPFMHEHMSIATFGRGRHVFEELIQHVMEASLKKDMDKTKVFCLQNSAQTWEIALQRTPRPADSVILDENMLDELIEDAKRFLDARAWYEERGIPYRRGYLLFGPPGSGKTSFVTALAGKLGLNICLMTVSTKGLTDDVFAARMRDAPARACVLLEDVDAVFIHRDFVPTERDPGLTFSGLLNAIDGVASQEGRIFFMTTNHPEKLDPALTRPGRCDMVREFRLATQTQARQLFLRFFPTESALAGAFADSLPESKVSMAMLQAHMTRHRDRPLVACRTVRDILNERDTLAGGSTPLRTWLFRLALPQYHAALQSHGLCTVQDIFGFKGDQLASLGVIVLGHRVRMLGMLQGLPTALRLFSTVTSAEAEKLFVEHFSSLDPPMAAIEAERETIGAPTAVQPAAGGKQRKEGKEEKARKEGSEERVEHCIDPSSAEPHATTVGEAKRHVAADALRDCAARFASSLPTHSISGFQIQDYLRSSTGGPGEAAEADSLARWLAAQANQLPPLRSLVDLVSNTSVAGDAVLSTSTSSGSSRSGPAHHGHGRGRERHFPS